MSSTKCLFMCISFFILGIKANLAPFIKPCNWQDSDCIQKSSEIALPYMANGIPELGIPACDPLILDNVNADSGKMNLQFNNPTVTGAKNCIIVNITRKEEDGKSSGSITLDCPITITGEYVLTGQVVFIQATGSGPFEFKTDLIRLTADIALKRFKGKDGKKHYKVSSFQYKYEPIKRIHIQLDNMFDGDKSQAEPVMNLLNENWKDTVASLGKPLLEECIKKAIHNVDLFFRAIPCDELEIA